MTPSPEATGPKLKAGKFHGVRMPRYLRLAGHGGAIYAGKVLVAKGTHDARKAEMQSMSACRELLDAALAARSYLEAIDDPNKDAVLTQLEAAIQLARGAQ